MSRKGNWALHKTFRGCGKCARCLADRQSRPHGPYFELRRRNPADGKQQVIYLGRITPEPPSEAIDNISRFFYFDYKPDKEVILQMIADFTVV